jgi:cytochrome b561
MLLIIPITGFMMTSYHGYGTFFFFWELPPLWEQSNVYQIWGGFHKYLLPYIVYIILGAHVLGALKHQFIDKQDNAFKRMVS